MSNPAEERLLREADRRWSENRVRGDGIATLARVFNSLSYREPREAKSLLDCLLQDGFITPEEHDRIGGRLFRERPRRFSLAAPNDAAFYEV